MQICLWNKRKNNSLIDCISTLGSLSKIQHTESRHFKMGIDLWKHILSPLNMWNTFRDMRSYIMELKLTLYHVFKAWFMMGTQVSWCIWQARISIRQFVLASGRFWRGHLVMKTQAKTSTKLVSVGQKWPHHRTRVEWEYKSRISCTFLCSCYFKKKGFSLFLCEYASVLNELLPGKIRQRCAWRHLNYTWEFQNHRRGCPLGRQPTRLHSSIYCRQSITRQRRKWKIWPIEMHLFVFWLC